MPELEVFIIVVITDVESNFDLISINILVSFLNSMTLLLSFELKGKELYYFHKFY